MSPILQADGQDGAFLVIDDPVGERRSYRHVSPSGETQWEQEGLQRGHDAQLPWIVPRAAGGWVRFNDGDTTPSIALLDNDFNQLCRRELPADTQRVLDTYFVEDTLHVMWIDRIATFELGDPNRAPEG